MTISSSLNAGVAGLAANANRLASISDNIANSSTYGYKRVETDFHSMVITPGPGKYSAGGVRTTTQRLIDQSGGLVTTSNATDIAVRGRGFFPVTTLGSIGLDGTGYPMNMATTGSFRLDEAGYLRTSTGVVLMGWPADINGDIPAYPRDTSAALEPINIPRHQLFGEPTTEMRLGMNLPATDTLPGTSGDPRNLSVEYFDNLGMSQNLSLTVTPTVPAAPATAASNEWTLSIVDSVLGAEVGNYTLTFRDARVGGGYDPATGISTVTVGAGDIDLNLGAIGAATGGLTQRSNIFAPTQISKNGSPVGNMTGIEIDEGGYVLANFDTGISRRLYQVPLLDVSNPNGLKAMDNQTYASSADSGAFFMWDAGDGPAGELVSNALEGSTTDVAGELTSLIQTQRAYSSNAKVIQTVDEMLQETTNLKR